MTLETILEWIVNNAVEIGFVITGAVALATAIARLTPTDKDNKFIEKWIRRPAEWIANVGLPNLVKTRRGIKRQK